MCRAMCPFSLVDFRKTDRASVFPSQHTDDTIVFTVTSYTDLVFFQSTQGFDMKGTVLAGLWVSEDFIQIDQK